MKKIEVKCPSCKSKFEYYSSTFRPFCSEKCKMIDLGSWLNEDYTVEGRDNSVYIEESDMLKKLIEEDGDIY